MNDDPVTIPHKSPEAIKAVLDAAPRPPGATLVDEHIDAGQGDASTVVTRTYRIPGDEPACMQLVTAAKGTAWIVQDQVEQPLDAAKCDPGVPNSTYTDPGNDRQRAGYLRPSDGKPGGIHVEWRKDEIIYILDEGNLPG